MKRALLLLAVLLAGCDATDRKVVAAVVAPVQQAAADVLTPLVLDTQEVVQEALPPPPAATQRCDDVVHPDAAALIVRWEVTSPAAYERKYRRPIWPGGASGVTWGVGYDGGHQTRTTIRRDWADHPHVADLEGTSRVTGARAKALTPSLRHVEVDYPYASRVFGCATLPVYQGGARRALGPGFDALSPHAAGSLVSLGYNRGWSFKGERRAEMRTIRDRCVPERDARCIADALRAMCRHWEGTPNYRGLCARRHDEARLALR